MPRYDYECQSCGAIEEHVHGVSSPYPVVYCASCQNLMKKLITRVGINIPMRMTAAHDLTDDGSHKRYLESPEVQAKLKSGEYGIVN